MVSTLLALSLMGRPSPYTIVRDAYGVPKIISSAWDDGYRGFGRAVSQDRLWQMELSRRLARGRMAEIDPSARRSDEATLKQGYTDEELEQQVHALPERIQKAFQAYAEGVNIDIADREEAGALPKGYAEAGIKPEPWTVLDSAAIAVSLIRRFGTGGAGELRGLGFYEYLKTRGLKGRELDVLDDIAWANDPEAPVTLKKEDAGPPPAVPIFEPPSRAVTLSHLAQLPKTSLLELAGAVALAQNEPQKELADRVGVASHWGSYAVAVSAARSRTGRAFLLGGPQMGHSSPSVIHEACLRFGSDLAVQGISVPGVPVIVVGSTPDHAWTLTTGAADVEDIFVSKPAPGGGVMYGDRAMPLERIRFERKVKGGAAFTVTEERTVHGPVVLKASGGAVFSRQSPLWKKELTGIEALFSMAQATTLEQLSDSAKNAAPCFNLFFATTKGEIGWRLTGRIPIRARGLDPRFPTPSSPANQWKGWLSPSQMPHVLRPKRGLLLNWNNKPVWWFPNGDTPVWGRFFRSRLLEEALPKGLIGRSDLELAAWTIARRDTSTPSEFRSLLLKGQPGDEMARQLRAADGWALEGSAPAMALKDGVAALREEVFSPVVGSLLSPEYFSLVLQPEAVYQAAVGKSRFPYLAGRKGVLEAAVKKAEERFFRPGALQAGYQPGSIKVTGQPDIPYINRGTYIQIVEMSGPPVARTIASPGAAESGPHSLDQAPLARAWLYKPAWGFKP